MDIILRFSNTRFQHTAARRRLDKNFLENSIQHEFQHTAARRRLVSRITNIPFTRSNLRFNTQPPEGGWLTSINYFGSISSFNTQPPEGGWQHEQARKSQYKCFNTQPPEGGWFHRPVQTAIHGRSFNTQPPEGGWFNHRTPSVGRNEFQHTAARRRLAAYSIPALSNRSGFNTQPPEGGWWGKFNLPFFTSCFNTQPPEGGWPPVRTTKISAPFCFNTQPPEGGWSWGGYSPNPATKFQHTAARRRLVARQMPHLVALNVSTHSRPKAAGRRCLRNG